MNSNGSNGVIDFAVSMVRSAIDTETTNKSSRDLLEGIANGRWHDQVQIVRDAFATGGKAAADAPKKRLPAVMWSGTFSRRAGDALQKHSGLICVDLDKLDDQVEAIRDLICTDEHTLACFISPTGTGLKVLFRCDPEREHIASFRAAERFVLEHFGLEIDKACKDVARLCFVSCDPDAFISENATPIPYPPEKVEFLTPVEAKPGTALLDGLHPGDDYDLRADVPALLTTHGWKKFGQFGWTRPGKENGISATWNKVPGRFYVFSSEAPPFEANHVYKPWHIFGLLECGGVWKDAAKKLGEQGFGTQLAKRDSGIPPDALAQLDAEHEETALAGTRDYESDGTDGTSGTQPFTLWRPTQFLAHKVDPNACLLGEGFVELGQWTSFIGIGGLGKTRLALWFIVCQILNKPWCGLMTHGKPQKSVFLSSENGIRRWKTDLEKMLPQFTDAERTALDENIRILAMTPDEEGDMCLGNHETCARLEATLKAENPGVVIFDPFADMVDGDENKAVDLVNTLRTLRRITRAACPTAAIIIIHHARTGAGNVMQAGDNFNAGNFGRGSKTLYSRVRCEIQLAPQDRDNANSFVMACGKSNDCQKFETRCVVMDPETFTYSIDSDFDVDAWRDDVSGKRKQGVISVEEIVSFIRQKCPLPGEEIDLKSVVAEFEPSGASERSIQRYVKTAIDAGYLRRGNKRWLIKLGVKPL